MNDKKLENQMLWCVIATMIMVILALIMVMLYGENDFPLLGNLVDPVAIFVGALLGALITGKVANDIHKKEFDRLAGIEKKESHRIKRVLFFYTNNIETLLVSIQMSVDSIGVVRLHNKNINTTTSDKEVYAELILESRGKILTAVQEIIQEYEMLSKVPIEKLDLLHLEKFLLYRSLMQNTSIPILDKIKEENLITWSVEDINKVREINSDFLRENII